MKKFDLFSPFEMVHAVLTGHRWWFETDEVNVLPPGSTAHSAEAASSSNRLSGT